MTATATRRVCLLKSTPCPPWCEGKCVDNLLRYSSGGLSVTHARYADVGSCTVAIMRSDFLHRSGRRDDIVGDRDARVLVLNSATYETLAAVDTTEEYRALLRMGPVLLPGVADGIREAGALLGWEVS